MTRILASCLIAFSALSITQESAESAPDTSSIEALSPFGTYRGIANIKKPVSGRTKFKMSVRPSFRIKSRVPGGSDFFILRPSGRMFGSHKIGGRFIGKSRGKWKSRGTKVRARGSGKIRGAGSFRYRTWIRFSPGRVVGASKVAGASLKFTGVK